MRLSTTHKIQLLKETRKLEEKIESLTDKDAKDALAQTRETLLIILLEEQLERTVDLRRKEDQDALTQLTKKH